MFSYFFLQPWLNISGQKGAMAEWPLPRYMPLSPNNWKHPNKPMHCFLSREGWKPVPHSQRNPPSVLIQNPFWQTPRTVLHSFISESRIDKLQFVINGKIDKIQPQSFPFWNQFLSIQWSVLMRLNLFFLTRHRMCDQVALRAMYAKLSYFISNCIENSTSYYICIFLKAAWNNLLRDCHLQ